MAEQTIEGNIPTPCICGGGMGAHALYPLFVDLTDKPVVVVGAGNVAERKVATLLEYGACVRVISPTVSSSIRTLHNEGRLTLAERAFDPSDIDDCVFVIAATDDDEVNRAVFTAAQEAAVLVNVVDVPDMCTAAVPSVLQRGLLQIAVSTSGAAPSLARRIRQGLEDNFPAWWEDYVALLGATRSLVKARVFGPASVRTPLFEALTDGRLQQRVALGEELDAEDVYRDYVVPLLTTQCDSDTGLDDTYGNVGGDDA